VKHKGEFWLSLIAGIIVFALGLSLLIDIPDKTLRWFSLPALIAGAYNIAQAAVIATTQGMKEWGD